MVFDPTFFFGFQTPLLFFFFFAVLQDFVLSSFDSILMKTFSWESLKDVRVCVTDILTIYISEKMWHNCLLLI
jgi:hypothetical protein